MTRRTFQMFSDACDTSIYNSLSIILKWFEDFRMKIRNVSTTSSKSNQQRSINTALWESRDITNQPGEIIDRNSKVIAMVVNAGVNIFAIGVYIKIKEGSLYVWSICFI